MRMRWRSADLCRAAARKGVYEGARPLVALLACLPPAGDGDYGVPGESASCRRGAGGIGVGVAVSGVARNASMT